MREAYQKMMGQISLSDDARGTILEKLEGSSPAQRRSVRPGRWAAAACLCLCLALALPVAAATVNNLWLRFQPEESRWEADVPTSDRMPASAFSQQVRDLAQGPERDIEYVMADIEEAEEFLGVPLPDNPLLNGAIKRAVFRGPSSDGKTVSGSCEVSIHNDQNGDLIAVHTYAFYTYRRVMVQLWCAIPTDLNPYENGGGKGVAYGENGAPVPGEAPVTEEYVTPSGLACTLVLLEEDDRCNGYAYVVMDRVLTEITAWGWSAEQTRNVLTELLDAYQ